MLALGRTDECRKRVGKEHEKIGDERLERERERLLDYSKKDEDEEDASGSSSSSGRVE